MSEFRNAPTPENEVLIPTQSPVETFLLDTLGYGRLIDLVLKNDELTRKVAREMFDGTLLGTSHFALMGLPIIAKIRTLREAQAHQRKVGGEEPRSDLPYHFLSKSLLYCERPFQVHELVTTRLATVLDSLSENSLISSGFTAVSGEHRIYTPGYELYVGSHYYGWPAVVNFSFNTSGNLIDRINSAVSYYAREIRNQLK